MVRAATGVHGISRSRPSPVVDFLLEGGVDEGALEGPWKGLVPIEARHALKCGRIKLLIACPSV